MNNTSTNKFLTSCTLIMLLISCTNINSTDQLKIQIPSLKEQYPKLLLEAQQWDKNVYLYSASIPVTGYASKRQIVTNFVSPSDPDTSIILTAFLDGSISKDFFQHTVPIMQREPIRDNDWIIDSDEALQIILSSDNEAEKFLRMHQTHCSELTLERFTPENTQPVVWSFSTFDCNFELKHYYLDPLNGELLNLSRSTIPDAILLTPFP